MKNKITKVINGKRIELNSKEILFLKDFHKVNENKLFENLKTQKTLKLKQYILETDSYIIECLECNKKISEDIRSKRKETREKIKEIEKIDNLEDLQKYEV